MPANDVFNRKEMKYRLTSAQRDAILAAMEGRMQADSFGTSRVTSVYYDTPAHEIIERSMDKPLYKEKLRVRGYGLPSAADPSTREVFVELKKKFKGIVYKRRVKCSLSAAQAYMQGLSFEEATARYPLPTDGQPLAPTPKNRQIAREIDAFRQRWGKIVPAMVIAVDRTAYAPVEGAAAGAATMDASTSGQASLRITFDENARYCDLIAAHGSHAKGAASACVATDDALLHAFDGACESCSAAVIPADECIMEIKCVGSLPSWLVDALSSARIYPSSFSKYGTAYSLCA